MSPVDLPSDKILGREELLSKYGRPRTVRLVFTNGCFDILHPGHVVYLAHARALGDALVVGLNSDGSVRRLKGVGHPMVGQQDRATVLAALGAVDAVTLFSEDTPTELIEALLPDVLVKGGDYEAESVAGREAVLAAGGSVEIVPFVAGYSTTSLVERIRAQQP